MLTAKVIAWTGEEVRYPNCLAVTSYRDPTDSSKVLASVDHFIKQEEPGVFPWEVISISNESTPFAAAMALAEDYAQEKDILVILVNNDGMSSDTERHQSDTVILRTQS